MKSIKRILVFLLVAVAAVSSAQAQFRFGIKAGANFNKIHLTDAKKTFSSDNGAGFTGGVMTEFQIPIIGLCFDASLMYTRMNGDVIMSDEGTKTKTDANNFFEIPINIKYKFGLPVVSNIITPYIFTGPDFAFRLGGQNNYFKTKDVQYAWNIGVGVELISHLQVQGSYGFGINNMMEKTNLATNIDTSIKGKNNYWTVTAAWLF